MEELATTEVDQNRSEENMEQPDDESEQKEASVDGAVAGGDAVAEGGEKKLPGWPGESVFRLLVPTPEVGGIIGRKGEFIKKIVEETGSRIKILDGPPGTPERTVMVSAREKPDSSLPPAIDGLLRIHQRLLDGLERDASHATSVMSGKVSTKLLVPASQAGNLIGKQGATVKSIQEATTCIVRVLGQEELPVFALQDDRVVEVVGDLASVHKAVELIASHLRKFLVDRTVIPIFELNMQAAHHHVDRMGPNQSWNPTGFGPTQYIPPPRQPESYYSLPEMPLPMERQPHHSISAYGREDLVNARALANARPAPSMATQMTQQMQIPLSYADAVIGLGGANISYIRRASGATVTVQESRGIPGEMTVEISGTASQVQAAQQLIHNFMAEAAVAPPQQPPGGGSTDQGYNPYLAHGSVYGATYGY